MVDEIRFSWIFVELNGGTEPRRITKGNRPRKDLGPSPLAVTLRGGEFGRPLHLLGDRGVAAASFGQSNGMRMP